MKDYTLQIRENVMQFFLEQNKDGYGDADTILTIIIESEKEFRGDIMNKLGNRIFKEKDFYEIGENNNFIFYKKFMEKCKDYFQIPEINAGIYYNEVIMTQNKIFNDLKKKEVEYNKILQLIEKDENNSFLNKIKVITQNEKEGETIYNELLTAYQDCRKKYKQLDDLINFYEAFYKNIKVREIEIIKKVLNEFNTKKISEIITEKNYFINDSYFNINKVINEGENIKYKYSIYFMSIYNEIKDSKQSEDELYKSAKSEFKSCLTRIINQNETKEPFFKIDNAYLIIEATTKNLDKMDKEINFILKEFEFLEKDDYIKNDLLKELINFSKKDELLQVLEGIINFIQIFTNLKNIKETDFISKIKEMNDIITSETVGGKDITYCNNFLKTIGYDINTESELVTFYKSFQGESIMFMKDIKDSKIDIRNLNEFIVESAESEVQTSDIENLIKIYNFYLNIIDDEEIKTDETLLNIFNKKFNDEKIYSDIDRYQQKFGEIKRIYELYEKNPVMTIQTIQDILRESEIEFYKENNIKLMNFKIYLKNKDKNIIAQKEKKEQKDKKNEEKNKDIINSQYAEDLRNKILLTMSNYREIVNNDSNKFNKNELSQEYKKYINLIEHINNLIKTLNNLIKLGYPKITNFSVNIKNGEQTNLE